MKKRDASASIRIGFGYDIHRMARGRKFILGGVRIPSEKGLLGHSDADVLLHAVCDALLGAAGLGDIGRHFPNSSRKYRNIASLKLLRSVAAMISECGFEVQNVDSTVVLELPKIALYADRMRRNISRVVGIPASCVSVKATTNEGLGAIGRGEGCAAYAVALLRKTR